MAQESPRLEPLQQKHLKEPAVVVAGPPPLLVVVALHLFPARPGASPHLRHASALEHLHSLFELLDDLDVLRAGGLALAAGDAVAGLAAVRVAKL